MTCMSGKLDTNAIMRSVTCQETVPQLPCNKEF